MSGFLEFSFSFQILGQKGIPYNSILLSLSNATTVICKDSVKTSLLRQNW